MPKSNLAPSQNWDINSQIEQSKDIAKQQQKDLNNYKKKTDAINRINSKLDEYESLGMDVSQYRKRLDTKTKDLELGFGEKLGVIGRNIGNDYSRAIPGIGRFLDKHIMNKKVKPIPKSYSQQMDAAKQDREETINPISTMALEVGMDPLTYTPLRFASKGTRLARAAKDFGKGSALSTGTYTMKEIGNDNFKAKDALLAGAFGGVLNSGIGAFANRKIKGNLLNGDVTSHENIMQKGLQEGKEITVPRGEKIKHKTVETAEPYADETMQDEYIDDDEIARRMLNQNEAQVNQKLPNELPTNDEQAIKDLMKYAVRNDAIDEFISKLPDTANKEETFKVLKKLEQQESSNTLKKPNIQEQNNINLPPMNEPKPRQTQSGILYSNGSQNLGGAFLGGSESEFTQRDYNNDGVHDYKDNVIGALIGVLGVNGAKKIFPKAFKDENINENTASMFVGKEPKDINRVSNQGKYKIPLTDEVKDMSKIKANELSFKEFNNPNAKHKEQGIVDSKSLKRHIDKILQNPNIYAKGTQKNSSLVALKKNGADDIVVVNSNTGNVISGFKNTDEKYMDKVINKSMGGRPSSTVLHQGVDSTTSFKDGYNVVPNTKTDETTLGQPSAINKSISKDIPKSQDIKLNASPTISGGMVGGLVGGTNDLDGDGKITAKDIAIGALGGAGATKGLTLAKNTLAISKATKELKNIADTDFVDAFIGHKIYQKKDYMKLREMMLNMKNKKMENYAELHEQLSLLSKDTKEKLHRYMIGEQGIEISKPLKNLADNYTKEIEKMGKQLVDLGVLEKEQFEKFQGRYLHRVYEKDLLKNFSRVFNKGKTISGVHTRGNTWNGTKTEYERLLKENKIGSFFDGKIEAHKLDNGQYRFSQDWTKEQRAKWGEIEDVAYTLPETLMRMNDMLEHGKFLKNVVDKTKIVSDDALDGYVQLNGKKFGALNGKYVPKDIKSDITEFNRALFGENNEVFDKEVKEAFNSLSTFWKKSHTVYNPVAHVNNLFSNITMQYMEGINPVKAVINAKKGAQAYAKLGQFRKLIAKKLIGLTEDESKKLKELSQDEDLNLYIKANDAGLFGRSRLNDVLGKYIKPNEKISKGKSIFKNIDNVSSKYYEGEDNIMRFSMLKSLVDKGKSFDEALEQVNKVIPDYTKPMSAMARIGRRTMLTPFISWTYYSTPIILRQLKEHPGRAVSLLGALYGINKAIGIDPYDKKDIPQQNFSMKRIPIYKNGREVTTIKVDRWIPHNEILSPLDFVRNLYNAGAWKGGYEVLNNKNLYYGGKLTYNKGARKAYDISKYAVQQITPDVLDKAWNLAESAVLNKKTRTKNPVIQPRSTLQELLNAAGLNTLTYNKNNQRKKVISEELRK